MGDHHHGAGIVAQVLFEPGDGFGVQMVGRFVKQQQVRLRKQELAKRHTAALTTRKAGYGRVAGRATQRIHGHFDLIFQIPQVLAVDHVLELCALIRRFVGIVHHQFVVAVDDRRLARHAFHDVFHHGLVLVELRLLLEITERRTLGEPGFTGIFLVEASHDFENGRLTGAVRAEDTDLGIGVEGEMDVLQNLLRAIGLVQPSHVIDELTCHCSECSTSDF